MSRALDLLLDAARLADCLANDRALTTAERAIRTADAKMTAAPRFRVDVDHDADAAALIEWQGCIGALPGGAS